MTGWFGNLATSVVEKIDEVSHIADNNSAPKAASQPPARVARQRSEHEQRAYELKVKNTTNPALLQWILGRQYPVIGNDFFFTALRDESKLRELQEHRRRVGLEDRVFFSIDDELLYFPFCADFGPLNIGCVYKFIQMLNEKLETYPKQGKSVVMVTTAKPETRTNAATLIGCYLVLEKGWTPEEAWAPFEFENASPFVTYRDASFDTETYHLLPIDILRGLYKAKQHKILDLSHFDMALFDYLDDPNNADMHEIMRGKFVAFKGPKAETKFHHDIGLMDLAPDKYVEALRRLNVSAVVRLNEPCYDEEEFKKEGFSHYDIYFDDCSTPDEMVLNKWFDACRAEKGALAVHCKAGLGRTGTLVCAWLMRKYQFTGAEVIGFIRVMRPGSILGEQQEFLSDNEEYMWSLGDPDLPPIHPEGDCLVHDEYVDPEELERAKQIAARRALENTEAMHRQAADRVAAQKK